MKLKSLKFASGLEVVSRIMELNDKIIMNRPFILGQAGEGFGFYRFMNSSDDIEFEISKNKIDVIASTSELIKQQYLEIVSNANDPEFTPFDNESSHTHEG